MNDWMQPYRREQVVNFEQWIDWVENHIDGVWEHPVYKHIDLFYRQHQQQYRRLRKADLKRYKPAPELPGYELVSDFYAPYEDESYPLEEVLRLAQGVGNFRTLTVADTRFVAEILNGYVLEYLKAEKHFTLQQVVNKRMYGELFFADPIQADQWRITVVNRLYTLKFTWNIADNQVSQSQLWLYTGKQQPSGWLNGKFPEAHTLVQQLDSTIGAFRWSLYEEVDREVLDFNRLVSAVPDKLTAYYKARRKDYIKLRNQELSRYPSFDEVYAKAFSADASELKEDLLSVLENEGDRYRVPDVMAPYEVAASYTIHNFRYMLMLRLKNHAEYSLTPWIVGEDIFSRKVADEVWEIQFFYYRFAVKFRWNIATDDITDLEIKTKGEVTIVRPVGVPPETFTGISFDMFRYISFCISHWVLRLSKGKEMHVGQHHKIVEFL